MNKIIQAVVNYFTSPTSEYWAWEWESDAERDAFRKWFKFAN